MKNIRMLMMIMGFAFISACASNETMDAAENDAGADAEVMEEAQPAAVEEDKVEAKAEMEAKAEEVDEQADVKPEAAAYASGNLVSTCNNGDAVRVIKVVYDNAETGNACEVIYEKSTGVQTLWSAINERDYCLGKAQAFVEKQEGWGWTCSNLE